MLASAASTYRPARSIELLDDEDDRADGVTTGVGAATALKHVTESDTQLLVYSVADTEFALEAESTRPRDGRRRET